MDNVMAGYSTFVFGVRYALFVIAVIVAVIALLDWAVRTRRLNPFGAVGRFTRRVFDPIMAPIERRVVRSGGLPQNAPWWTLVVVVVGGLILVYLLNFLGGILAEALAGANNRSLLGRILLSWAFGLLRLALLVRVVASWFRISPYSGWIRWSYVLTEWMLAPLRRFIPPFGMVDVTPLIAFFLLQLIQGAIRV
jgi:YggT family protein